MWPLTTAAAVPRMRGAGVGGALALGIAGVAGGGGPPDGRAGDQVVAHAAEGAHAFGAGGRGYDGREGGVVERGFVEAGAADLGQSERAL